MLQVIKPAHYISWHNFRQKLFTEELEEISHNFSISSTGFFQNSFIEEETGRASVKAPGNDDPHLQQLSQSLVSHRERASPQSYFRASKCPKSWTKGQLQSTDKFIKVRLSETGLWGRKADGEFPSLAFV
jgi:hypothetical protein